MSTPALDDRQLELMQAFVTASDASGHVPFDFPADDSPLDHPAWPTNVQVPAKDEVRALLALGLLTSDRSVAPHWRVFPSEQARIRFGAPDHERIAEALRDPDRRLAVILEATVQAFEGDASEPLYFASLDQVSIVKHSHWPLAPDVVRSHDLAQLRDLGLVGVEPRGGDDLVFWPTSDGRSATHDPAGYLDRRADAATDEQEKGRFRRWAEKSRAGDVAVGALTGTTVAVIRALTGL